MSWHWESFVFAIIAFVVLYWLLNKYAFGPLFGIMEERRRIVAEQISKTEQDRKAAESLLAEQKEAMQNVRKEAQTILEQARAMSNKQSQDIIDQAKEEAVRLKEEAVRDIETEKNKAVASLRNEVSAMSVLIASKIIEKQIDEKSQEELVEHYLKEVGGKQ
ncbi:F0F1 ATP synthase subunit B [Paenibacillus validus]|uniref:ATP synthase subunit b n=1 Tax=Paenibacillus validus TaxID=44253 RepID=A0A7X2ZDY4_9BACL|nr:MULTISPECIES: F0F1 ATP synthase subunit B [Paenibacillus]MED4601483.1 F0F1 ATP synthase subunit B [Paenibacillus validus]MED4607005.1 F0F1 ATP synthase subunit B [Paenibacillus validus]MUG72421.1 F0F1 ATP synthase subunit B [Paenibacillus validus]